MGLLKNLLDRLRNVIPTPPAPGPDPLPGPTPGPGPAPGPAPSPTPTPANGGILRRLLATIFPALGGLVQRNWGAWLRYALLLAGYTLLLTWLPWLACIVPTPTPPIPMDPPEVRNFGWVHDDDAVNEVVKTILVKRFSDTPAFRAWQQDPADSDVYLWDAARRVLGDVLPARDQGQIGSCVSFGTNSAIEHLLLVQLANKINPRGPPRANGYKDLVQEATYGLSRVQIGGGGPNDGDGSTGAWAAQAVKKYGVLPREKVGSYDLTKYSISLCKSWGARGLPKDLEPEASKSPVKSITLVKTTDELIAALRNGYPVAVCSGQGFASTRDADGFARASGSWSHCMCILGYRADRPGFFIWNSWGPDWIKGPKGAGNPPEGGFWAEKAVVARMLAQNDSWAFSSAVGFPSELDWFVRRGSTLDTEILIGFRLNPFVGRQPLFAEVGRMKEMRYASLN